MEISVVDKASSNLLSIWRNSILDGVADIISNPYQGETHRKSGMWGSYSDFDVPPRSCISILPNGSLVFDCMVNGQSIHFVAWVTFGEVRIGVKVPVALIPDVATQEKIRAAFDGKPCSREEDSGGCIIFDWIFREGFASSSHMMTALHDKITATVISWRMGETLAHLYFSILSAFPVGLVKPQSFPSISNHSGRVTRRFEVFGDIDAFRLHVAARGGVQIGVHQSTDSGLKVIFIEMDISRPEISVGQYRDMDGCIFRVVNVEDCNIERKEDFY